MKSLLDTCVLSELYKAHPHEYVKKYIDALVDDHLYISVITLGEIEKGIAVLPESKRKNDLELWVNEVAQNYKKRILPITHDVSRIWGKITAKAQKEGFILPVANGLIAATAICHGLHLITRNVKDFDFTNVLLVNPWEG